VLAATATSASKTAPTERRTREVVEHSPGILLGNFESLRRARARFHGAGARRNRAGRCNGSVTAPTAKRATEYRRTVRG